MRAASEGALRLDCALCLVQEWSLFCVSWQNGTKRGGKLLPFRGAKDGVSHTISASAVTRPVRSADRQTDNLARLGCGHRHGLGW
eukprot:scaffold66904_cov37-Phaeocystis_antarctica.AAC.1